MNPSNDNHSNNYNGGYNDTPYNNNNYPNQPHNSNGNNNITSYYPTPNSNPYNPALQNSMNNNNYNNQNVNSNALAYSQSSGGVKYPLNKEFSSVLERGSLEEVARLLESTAPRPEVRIVIFCVLCYCSWLDSGWTAIVTFLLFSFVGWYICSLADDVLMFKMSYCCNFNSFNSFFLIPILTNRICPPRYGIDCTTRWLRCCIKTVTLSAVSCGC